MVGCPACNAAGGAGAAMGVIATVALGERFPILHKYPYALPIAMGFTAFSLSSATMAYTGYNIFQHVLSMFTPTSSNAPHSCHNNEKPQTMVYTFLPTNFTTDSEIVTITKCTEGSAQNERFTLAQPINHVFGRGGLDVFVLGDEKDHLYFSMCSTKIIDGHVATVYNFDDQKDEIYLFCTKQQLDANDVTTKYNQSENVTYIEIAGKFERTAIAVVGDYPNLSHNIVLNEKYTDVGATGICTESLIEA